MTIYALKSLLTKIILHKSMAGTYSDLHMHSYNNTCVGVEASVTGKCRTCTLDKGVRGEEECARGSGGVCGTNMTCTLTCMPTGGVHVVCVFCVQFDACTHVWWSACYCTCN